MSSQSTEKSSLGLPTTYAMARELLSSMDFSELESFAYERFWDRIKPHLTTLENEARDGNPEAQYCFGICHEHGVEEHSPDAALSWFTRAAHAGHPKAAFAVVVRRLFRDWVPIERGAYTSNGSPEISHEEALTLLRIAAAQGHAKGQLELALLLKNIASTRQNSQALLTEALAWLHQAAQSSDPRSRRHLAVHYLLGDGVAANRQRAKEELEKASEQGDALSMLKLAELETLDNDGAAGHGSMNPWYVRAARQMCSRMQHHPERCKALGADRWSDVDVACHIADWLDDQLPTREDRADGLPNVSDSIRWYEYAASRGNAYAQNGLADLLRRGGDGMEPNHARAVHWYLLAAEAGNPSAQTFLGDYFLAGNGVTASDEQACRWWRRAAELGDSTAQYKLGWMFERGSGVPQDYAQAAHWYRMSAEQGIYARPSAQYNLGRLYHLGLGVEKNLEKATDWYWAAKLQCHAMAEFVVGTMLEEGEFFARDIQRAMEQYQRCCDRVPEAAYRLALMQLSGAVEPPSDLSKTFKMLLYAAENGIRDAMLWVGHMLKQGLGIPLSLAEAQSWFQRAANAGDRHAVEALADPAFLQLQARPELGSSGFRTSDRVHRTARGELVRSKSEVIVADALFQAGAQYHYELLVETPEGPRLPDFTVITKTGRRVLWEHLGMLDNDGYAAKWEIKRRAYEVAGFTLGVDLFLTRDDPKGGIDSAQIRLTAQYVASL